MNPISGKLASDPEKIKRAERLAVAFDGRKPGSVARAVGISPSTMFEYAAGRIPSSDAGVRIADELGIRLRWWILGEGEMRPATSMVMTQEQSQGLPGMVLVPRLTVEASAGRGRLPPDDEGPTDLVAFHEAWLRERGISPRHVQLLTAVGDSMEPTIRDGDTLIVDRAIDHLIDEGIYVVVYSGLVLVKRLQLRFDGSLVLSSDNKEAYREEVVPKSELGDLVVAGRVRWFGRGI